MPQLTPRDPTAPALVRRRGPSDRASAPETPAAPAAATPPRYTLADALAAIPKTKRSQVELLVRTGKIVPAWPSMGTGHDRAFDFGNLFEIAVAAELIELGFVGQRLAFMFRQVVLEMRSPHNAPDAEYLVLLPHRSGGLPVKMLAGAELDATLGLFEGAYVLNARRILGALRAALDETTPQQTARETARTPRERKRR